MRIRRHGVRVTAPKVTFTFNGTPIRALKGESMAAALAAEGVVAVRRTKSGAVRGPFCAMGACFDCVVEIDGRRGQRSCLTKVRGGEVVRTEGLSHDGGPLCPLATPPKGPRLPERCADILVVGAGPAGLAAARAARRAGASVIVLDERKEPGGQYFKPVGPAHQSRRPPDGQFAEGKTLTAAVHEAGVDVVAGASVAGAFSPGDVLAFVGGEATVFRQQRLILATGAYERPVPIPGWTLPGVMTSGAAQTLMRSDQVAPGTSVLVAGNGPLNAQLAADLVRHGVKVVALVEAAQAPSLASARALIGATLTAPATMARGAGYLLTLRRAGVPVLWGHGVIEIHGETQVEAVTIAPLNKDGRLDHNRATTHPVDTVCLNAGFVSASEIASALGCEMARDPRHLGSPHVVTDGDGATGVQGVYAVGDGAYVEGAAVALSTGEIAGHVAATALGYGNNAQALRAARRKRDRARAFQRHLWRLFSAPPSSLHDVPDKTVLCRCEELSFGRVRGEIYDGAASLAVLKRRLRLGMGRCQGKMCAHTAGKLLREMNASTPEPLPFAPRFPAKPFPAAALAVEKPEWGGHKRAGLPNLARPSKAPPFGKDRADVVVIGGGVVGACLAFELATAGVDTLVLERDDVNLQASGANAGSLHVQLLSFDFGAKAEAGGGPAADTLPLGPLGVAVWKELAAACGGRFEIRVTGGLMVAETKSGMAFLKDKVALERSHGIDAHLIGADELFSLAPHLSRSLVGAEYAPGEGKINPLAATYAVMDKAVERGARLLKGVNVEGLERDGAVWRVRTDRGTVTAGRVVNAAGPWASLIGAMAGVRVPVHSAPLQMIVTEPAPPLVDQLIAHADRHLSLKQLSSGALVIGGAWTARYAPEQNLNVTTRDSLEGNLWVAHRVLPQLAGLHVLRTWAGMNVNIDGAPIVGEAPGAPGFFNCVTSNGYTLAPIVARLTAELMVRGRTELNLAPYLIDRFVMDPPGEHGLAQHTASAEQALKAHHGVG
ncbi:MAG: FAD-dependent oxidoreductase [Pseudomonadota bacterium]